MDEEQDEREGSILFVADGFYHKTTDYVLMTIGLDMDCMSYYIPDAKIESILAQ